VAPEILVDVDGSDFAVTNVDGVAPSMVSTPRPQETGRSAHKVYRALEDAPELSSA
jgi:hypothetical protein